MNLIKLNIQRFAINVSQAFARTSANPIDESIALTKAKMLTVNDNLMPAYYFTICQDDGYIYLYDKSATPSVTTGKFTKFEGGGGGGGSAGSVYNGTLLSSGWNSTTHQQTVTFTNYTASYNGVIGVPGDATSSQLEAYKTALIRVVSQSNSTVTFYAETIPSIDLPVSIYCGGGDSGSGVPPGGTAGQIIVKQSSTDGDVAWEDNEGGHTIQNDSGTDLAQEPKLQFKGLSVTDDSTNTRTKVEAVGLNSDDLDDILSSASVSSNIIQTGMCYSTTEQVVGKWVDGKPIYQKTWVNVDVSGMIDGTNHNIIDITSLHADSTIKIEAIAHQVTSGQKFDYPNTWYSPASTPENSLKVAIWRRAENYIGFNATTLSIISVDVTLQYTKTTD